METYPPKIFISYSWDDDKLKEWVLKLADQLSYNGVYVFLDRYDLRVGKDMIRFMETSLEKADKVLLILTPNYKNKAEGRVGGVGCEYSIITSELYTHSNTEKFIPILKKGTRRESTPSFLRSRVDHDMSNEKFFEADFKELLRIIYNRPVVVRPPLGSPPSFLFPSEEGESNAKDLSEKRRQPKERSSDDKPEINIATLGQIDHGKTTLTFAIMALLAKKGLADLPSFDSLDNDSGKEEEGTCIRASYVKYETGNRRYAHMDCPGHIDYLANLITGIARIDGAILVVSAAEGPLRETCEQLLLARQLNIMKLVVFINKCDKVGDEERWAYVEMQTRELLNSYDFDGDGTPVICGSALGALNGIPEWEESLMEMMEQLDLWIPLPGCAVDKPFLMPVEDVFSIKGHGTVITGRIETGYLRVGDEIQLIGFGAKNKKSVVTGIEMSRLLLDGAQAGDNVGLLLRGVEEKEIQRGMVVCQPGKYKAYSRFQAEIYILTEEEAGKYTRICNKQCMQFYIRTVEVTGEITLLKGIRQATSGKIATIDVRLASSVGCNVGLHFALRENDRTLSAGVIIKLYD